MLLFQGAHAPDVHPALLFGVASLCWLGWTNLSHHGFYQCQSHTFDLGSPVDTLGFVFDTFLSKIPSAPCYCWMMGRTLKEEIRITQYNNPTKAGKYSLEDLFRASDYIPHHYPKF